MIKLNKASYSKIKPLIKSRNEISIFSVIDGNMPGEIFVNNESNPTAVLIKTCECNLVAGNIDNTFISEISSELDFWDCVTPDSQEWFGKIPLLHKNKFIRPFKRRHYTLDETTFIKRETTLPDGFMLEELDVALLRKSTYKNANKVLEWIDDWDNDSIFSKNGTGTYIHNGEIIVSWSLSDCCFGEQITIGVNTDEKYRNQGFGIKVVSETIMQCFRNGYKTINWLCLDSNRGSIAIAEKLGFTHSNDYFYFCSYLPTENPLDISEEEWLLWAKYLEESMVKEPQLINECLYTYMKANHVFKVIEIIKRLPQFGRTPDIKGYKRDIRYFQSIGLCSNFNNSDWLEFID